MLSVICRAIVPSDAVEAMCGVIKILGWRHKVSP
ncbi:MAG: hypothetical protein ACI9I0_001810, partial [Rhodoferax sp.]